jgi:hypothetical protein
MLYLIYAFLFVLFAVLIVTATPLSLVITGFLVYYYLME